MFGGKAGSLVMGWGGEREGRDTEEKGQYIDVWYRVRLCSAVEGAVVGFVNYGRHFGCYCWYLGSKRKDGGEQSIYQSINQSG